VLHRLRVVRPDTAAVMITGEGTIDAAVEAMKAGAVDFVEKPYDLDALRRTLKAVEEERRAKELLGESGGAGVGAVLSEAADRARPRGRSRGGLFLRRALGSAPGNARIPRQSDPSSGRGVRLRLRAGGVFGDPQEELRRLVLETLVPPGQTPDGRPPREGGR